jgi:hypothetical protein
MSSVVRMQGVFGGSVEETSGEWPVNHKRDEMSCRVVYASLYQIVREKLVFPSGSKRPPASQPRQCCQLMFLDLLSQLPLPSSSLSSTRSLHHGSPLPPAVEPPPSPAETINQSPYPLRDRHAGTNAEQRTKWTTRERRWVEADGPL